MNSNKRSKSKELTAFCLIHLTISQASLMRLFVTVIG